MLETKIEELTVAIAALTEATLLLDKNNRTMFSMMAKDADSTKIEGETPEGEEDQEAAKKEKAAKAKKEKAAKAKKEAAAKKKAADKKVAEKEDEVLEDSGLDGDDDLDFMEEDEEVEVTKADVKAAVKELGTKSKKGAKFAKAILGKFDATNLTQLAEGDYAAVVEACGKALAKA